MCAGCGYVGLVDNWVGQGFELDSIVACVIACLIGGVSLRGGRGSIPGALAGAAIIIVIANEVLLFGLSIQIQIVIKGRCDRDRSRPVCEMIAQAALWPEPPQFGLRAGMFDE